MHPLDGGAEVAASSLDQDVPADAENKEFKINERWPRNSEKELLCNENDKDKLTAKINSDIKGANHQMKESKSQAKVEAGGIVKSDISLVAPLSTDSSDPEKCGRGAVQNEEGSVRDLRQYEKFVISKKYPYLEIEDRSAKQRSVSTPGDAADPTNRAGSNGLLTGDQGICEPMDDVRNIEIINRGLTGFGIPQSMHFATSREEKHLDKKTVAAQGGRHDDIVNRLKKLINEYEGMKYLSKQNVG